MTDAKVGASYQLPTSSRLDMHVKMHDKELSKFRGSKGSKHVPVSFAGGGTSCPSEEPAAHRRRWTAWSERKWTLMGTLGGQCLSFFFQLIWFNKPHIGSLFSATKSYYVWQTDRPIFYYSWMSSWKSSSCSKLRVQMPMWGYLFELLCNHGGATDPLNFS